ncbi:hypothetical protein H0E87_019832 [Populus deltoides]|uniref:Zinc finger (C3HC4-type RING finger) family protein n=1 Tax=Populus deltoides TaxID=3696 RepID=A0A8T2XWS5_POPDE|nr:hypothetical protein H0E87_019832 [Populus deltoides]
MGSKWRKAKLALGLNLCVYVPRTLDDSAAPSSERLSDAALLSPKNWDSRPMTPTPSSHGLRLAKSGSKSSKQTCSICLAKMKQGDGHAIFTAECSHSFHFHCISSNVKHGNQLCPVCRAKWKEIPFQAPTLDPLPGRASAGWPQTDALMTMVHRLPPPPRRDLNRRHVSLMQAPEPSVFDDDESLDLQPASSERSSGNKNDAGHNPAKTVEIKTYPEVSAASCSNSYDNFTVLVHIKAAATVGRLNPRGNQASLPQLSQTPRAPVDLVTVLDISGSMAGTKLALLKRAMGFVIQNLGSNDRLSVIAFSSTARRLFPLRRMSDTGRQHALQAVNSLVANGGTNIAEGLRKGAKVMEDRREKNPVASIILLSDGQDTYTVSGNGGNQTQPNYQLLLPVSIHGGSYPSRVMVDARSGFIDVGDLYADEERDFLVSVNVPAEPSRNQTSLLKVRCAYRDPLTKEMATLESEEIKLERPEISGEAIVSIEVDRQRNRFQAAEAMSRARTTAERGDLAGAASILENCRMLLSETVSAKFHDRLCIALDAELKEMQERMASRHVYEASGRAYILSGLSSHSWQRATVRGDSTDGSSLVQSYQTPSMTEMLARSQATFLGSPSTQRLVQPSWSFGSQPKPR